MPEDQLDPEWVQVPLFPLMDQAARYAVETQDFDNQDWNLVEQAISAVELDQEVHQLIQTQLLALANFRTEYPYRVVEQRFIDLLEDAESGNTGSFQTLLRHDLTRLRQWMKTLSSGPLMRGGVTAGLERQGDGVTVWSEVNKRDWLADPTRQLGTLQRLITSGVLDNVPGLTITKP